MRTWLRVWETWDGFKVRSKYKIYIGIYSVFLRYSDPTFNGDYRRLVGSKTPFPM